MGEEVLQIDEFSFGFLIKFQMLSRYPSGDGEQEIECFSVDLGSNI
jgi:hypothetical protein